MSDTRLKSYQWPADQITRRPVADLIPYARNARVHTPAQIASIAASIREWGWTMPILVDDAGTILAGHGRLLAAQQLGLDEVPCMVAEGWSEAKRRAYVLADNRLTDQSTFDMELVSAELQDLAALDYDLTLVGWDGEELARLLESADPLNEMPTLPDGDKAPFQQMTFTLHDTQAEQVSEALRAAKSMGDFTDSPNENSNGNALARICETFLTAHA